MQVLKTTGINYDHPSPFLTTNKLMGDSLPVIRNNQGSISTLHLELDVKGEIRGVPIDIYSPVASCGSACRQGSIPIVGSGGESLYPVEILRFAKDGHSTFQPGGIRGMFISGINLIRKTSSLFTGIKQDSIGFKWLVHMEDGYSLSGTISAEVADNPGEGVGNFKLGGKMVITYQAYGENVPVRLHSRKEPILEGQIREWPPRGEVIELKNGPIEYYKSSEIDNSGAIPVLTITSNRITFGHKEVSLLKESPEIQRVTILSPNGSRWEKGAIGGVELSWDDTRKRVENSDPPVEFYHIFRMFEDDYINNWMLIKSLPANITSWQDMTFNGAHSASYIVLHAARYNFDYRYESLVGTPVVVPSIDRMNLTE